MDGPSVELNVSYAYTFHMLGCKLGKTRRMVSRGAVAMTRYLRLLWMLFSSFLSGFLGWMSR